MLFRDAISARLRALLGARPRALDRGHAQARRDALEQRLLAEHQRRYSGAVDSAGAGSGARRRTPALVLVGRLALASLVLAGAGVAACQIPVEVEVELGRRYVFAVPASDPAEVEGLASALEQASGAEEIELRLHHDGGPTMSATLDLWGPDLDLAGVDELLAARGLTPSEVTPLDGSVRTTLGDRLGHELFERELDLDAMDVDEARAAILDRLAAQGFTGEAEVEVEDDGEGRRRVEIRLRETEVLDAPEPEAESNHGSGHKPEPSP